MLRLCVLLAAKVQVRGQLLLRSGDQDNQGSAQQACGSEQPTVIRRVVGTMVEL